MSQERKQAAYQRRRCPEHSSYWPTCKTCREASIFRCSQHGTKLVRTCPECRAETGFDDDAWDYYIAKQNGVVLPLPLCSHGNLRGKCPADCSASQQLTDNKVVIATVDKDLIK